jgi:ankyrin repeat protein
VDVNLAENDGATPLFLACQEGKEAVVTALLADPRVDVNLARTDGATPLFMACQKGHDIVVTVLLADPRVDVNLARLMAPPRCISRASKDTSRSSLRCSRTPAWT